MLWLLVRLTTTDVVQAVESACLGRGARAWGRFYLMKVLVTGSSGHLGEGLVRTLRNTSHEVIGLDLVEPPFTTVLGSITDRSLVRRCMHGVDAVIHAALHTPHVMARGPRDLWKRISHFAGTVSYRLTE